MALKMTKSEGGAEFSKCRRSGTLGGAWEVSGRESVAPVPGSEEKHKFEPLRSGEALGSWLQVREWESSSLQLVDGGLPARERAGVDSGGLGHPGRAREESFWRWERDSQVAECVGVQAQVQEVESHLGEKL